VGAVVTTTLLATFRARPGHAAQVTGLLSGYAASVRAAEGTVRFEPTTSVDDDHAFVVFERYVDDAAFRAHLAAPENAVFNDAVAEHLVGGVELAFLDEIAVR
jgi:quinol monooxygenase YgiN